MKQQVNHYLINIHRELQAAYLRKQAPQHGHLVDEVGVEERELQPGRAMFLTTLDEIYLTTADIGTLYVSALLPDGTLATGLSIAWSSGAYRITTTTDQTVWNLKVWTDNAATLEEKEAVGYDALPGSLWAWLKLDEGSGVAHFDSSGNGRHFYIPQTVDWDTHHVEAQVQYSWQNEVGYTAFPEVAFFPEYELVNGAVVDGAGIRAEISGTPGPYYMPFARIRLGDTPSGDNYYDLTGYRLPPGMEVELEIQLLDTNYPAYDPLINQGQFLLLASAYYRQLQARYATLGTVAERHYVVDDSISTNGNYILLSIDTYSDAAFDGLFWKFGPLTARPVTLVPRNEANPTEDVFGNPLTHLGRARYNALLTGRCGYSDGISKLQFGSIPSGVYVASYEGTATPTINRSFNRIELTAGTIWNLVLKDALDNVWAELPICEGGLCDRAMDVSGNARHASISTADLAYFWSQRQSTYSRLLTGGYTRYTHATEEAICIPYTNAGIPIGFPYWTPSGYVHAGEYPAGGLTPSGDGVDFSSGVATPWAAQLLAEDANAEDYEFGDGLPSTELHVEATATKEQKFYFEKL